MRYTWKANFDDATSLTQFDEFGDEVKFGDVEARFSELESFELIGEDGLTDSYVVDFVKGTIEHDGNIVDDTFKSEVGLSLVFKRRNQIRTDFGGEVLEHRTIYILGLTDGVGQATVEVFPGLEMAPAKIEKKYKDIDGKVDEDITDKIKDKVL